MDFAPREKRGKAAVLSGESIFTTAADDSESVPWWQIYFPLDLIMFADWKWNIYFRAMIIIGTCACLVTLSGIRRGDTLVRNHRSMSSAWLWVVGTSNATNPCQTTYWIRYLVSVINIDMAIHRQWVHCMCTVHYTSSSISSRPFALLSHSVRAHVRSAYWWRKLI